MSAVSIHRGISKDLLSHIHAGSFDATIRIWDTRYVLVGIITTNACLLIAAIRSYNMQPIQVLEDPKDSVMSVQVRGVEIVAG